MTFVRQGGFWEEVFRAIGEIDQANLLHLEWVDELRQLRKEEAQAISGRQRMELLRSTS
ncbi:hypothetical protein [Xanthomonas cannabis]|uniref:hypothetical protein n=1 Tax=Xanthomonas cannabis TaxID=1885674 RepID=UPI001F31165C|nr:hypothetical protein [Xanthomonas cannabis]